MFSWKKIQNALICFRGRILQNESLQSVWPMITLYVLNLCPREKETPCSYTYIDTCLKIYILFFLGSIKRVVIESE